MSADLDNEKVNQLISEKRYEEAKAILRQSSDPGAQKWLAKLEQLFPPPTPPTPTSRPQPGQPYGPGTKIFLPFNGRDVHAKFPSACVYCNGPAQTTQAITSSVTAGKRTYTVKFDVPYCLEHATASQATFARIRKPGDIVIAIALLAAAVLIIYDLLIAHNGLWAAGFFVAVFLGIPGMFLARWITHRALRRSDDYAQGFLGSGDNDALGVQANLKLRFSVFQKSHRMHFWFWNDQYAHQFLTANPGASDSSGASYRAG